MRSVAVGSRSYMMAETMIMPGEPFLPPLKTDRAGKKRAPFFILLALDKKLTIMGSERGRGVARRLSRKLLFSRKTAFLDSSRNPGGYIQVISLSGIPK